MKYCQKHWNDLRKAINDRGLSHLVARDGKEAADQLAAELSGKPSAFVDPLMAAHNMVAARSLEQGGLGIMGVSEDGEELCPVCEAMRRTEFAWTHGPADSVLALCQEKGLVPTPGIEEEKPE